MRAVIISFLLSLFFPLLVFAQNSSLNAGFVTGIWYSKEPFFAQEDIRIYAAVQNRSGFDIVGNVQFLDRGALIGTSSFSALEGRLIEVWTDWKALEGGHRFSVEIVNAKKSQAGKPGQPIVLSSPLSQETKLFVDADTDGDRIGNRQDLDDDNDTLSDEEEKSYGTNPLSKDTDGDGVFDPHEVTYGTNPLHESNELKESNTIEKISANAIRTVDDFINSLEEPMIERKEKLKREIVQEKPKKRMGENQLQKVEKIMPPSSLLLAKVPSFKELQLFLQETLLLLMRNWKWTILALGVLTAFLLFGRLRKR